MNYVPRFLAGTLRRAATTFPAVIVMGARQSGKTTLLREELGESHGYISLDRPDVRARLQADPVGFLDEIAGPVVLDEVQHVPEILFHLKERIDRDRRPGRWILTGSQTFPLMRGVGETLAGRVAVLTLDPFSVAEVRRDAPVPDLGTLLDGVFERGWGTGADLADWLLRGSFPEPRANPGVDRSLWYASYVQTYLERDVRDLAQVGDLETFRHFLFLVAARTGQLLNMAELAREVGITGPTVKRWLSVLETSRLVALLRPYHRNYGKRIRKSPKVYVLDPGLATFLMGLHSREAVLQGPSLGALAETAVVSEWIKTCAQMGESPHLSFWQSTTTAEVDLIVEHDGRLHGIEVKATATPTPGHAVGLARWLELAGSEARAVLACNVEHPVTVSPGIRAVPWAPSGPDAA